MNFILAMCRFFSDAIIYLPIWPAALHTSLAIYPQTTTSSGSKRGNNPCEAGMVDHRHHKIGKKAFALFQWDGIYFCPRHNRSIGSRSRKNADASSSVQCVDNSTIFSELLVFWSVFVLSLGFKAREVILRSTPTFSHRSPKFTRLIHQVYHPISLLQSIPATLQDMPKNLSWGFQSLKFDLDPHPRPKCLLFWQRCFLLLQRRNCLSQIYLPVSSIPSTQEKRCGQNWFLNQSERTKVQQNTIKPSNEVVAVIRMPKYPAIVVCKKKDHLMSVSYTWYVVLLFAYHCIWDHHYCLLTAKLRPFLQKIWIE